MSSTNLQPEKLSIVPEYKNLIVEENIWHRRKLAIIVVGLLILAVIAVIKQDKIKQILGIPEPYTAQLSHSEAAQFVPQKIAGISTDIALESSVQMLDRRAFILDSYFAANDSPLTGTGRLFVDACDKFGAPKDCVVVAAIARAETDLCKYSTSAKNHNCWGFGGGGVHRIVFSTWQQAIDQVTKTLVNNYGIEAMNDPTRMEKVFCGSEPGCTNWGNRVKYHMRLISEYPKSIGFSFSLFDLR